ncbi:serine/threonine protein kinase, partial [Streptomyces sp. ATE26]|nr:serine/threonine protein kinase [Streptomyces sp. ATE26]
QQQPRQAPQGRPQQPQPRGRQQPHAAYGYPDQQPQQYAPQRQPQRQPQRYAPPAPEPQRPAREPRAPRQRSANPMKIPGLGCLKGCLFTIVILVVASWLVWELTPLHSWVGQGRGYWQQLSDWAGQVGDWVKQLDGSSTSGN